MSSAGVAANPSLVAAASLPIDLIESKFDQLARRILDELKQTSPRSEFFQAIDQILSEPALGRRDPQAQRKLLLQKRRTASCQKHAPKDINQHQHQHQHQHHEQQPQCLDATGAKNLDTETLKRQCDSLAERQRQQQEQLDSHQQILFDSQYRSLPSEITQAVEGHEQRRAQHRAAVQIGVGALQKSSTQILLKNHKSPVQETSTPARVISKLAHDSSNQQHPFSLSSSSSPVKQQKLIISETTPKRTKVGGGGGVVSSASSSIINNNPSRQRSAIPQSTILSGIACAAYPLAKSATTTAATTGGTPAIGRIENEPIKSEGGLVRQASLKINQQTREAQQEFINRHTMGASLTASEKLKLRRPTKASIGGGASGNTPTSDDSDQLDDDDDENDDDDEDDNDDDDDDDDDDYEYQNLASRRAYLNQRFIGQSQKEQEQQEQLCKRQQVQITHQQPINVVGKTSSEASNKTILASRQSPNQQFNSASQVAKQRQRFSQPDSHGAPIVRSSTTVASNGRQHEHRPTVVSTSRPTSRNRANNDHDPRQEPRSLGGLLTSHDLGQLYKPHMNYSTSLLGNHRLSDDDEIIIIPTAQSPSLMSASVSPDPRHHLYHQHHSPTNAAIRGGASASASGDEQPDQTTNNMDEFSERFSISRTKSFWERLANSRKSPAGSGAEQQHNNSSVRSLTSSGHGGGASGGPNLVAVDAKSSQGSLLISDLKHSSASGSGGGGGGGGADADGHDDHHSLAARYPAAMKSAFDRMDSTGGSGNSHYSGCSSTSSASDADDGQVRRGTSRAGYGRLQAKGSMAACLGRPKATAGAPTIGKSPTIGQLIQQDELNRSDRFRQTR